MEPEGKFTDVLNTFKKFQYCEKMISMYMFKFAVY